MDGVHDLGGIDGTGPIDHWAQEPPFDADWERTVFASVLITMAQGAYSMDAFRHAIERMDPTWSLSSP
jgi:nitrile hydratase